MIKMRWKPLDVLSELRRWEMIIEAAVMTAGTCFALKRIDKTDMASLQYDRC